MISLKKVTIAFSLAVLFLTGCGEEVEGLTVQSTTFAKSNDEGKIVPVQDATYLPGEKVHFVLVTVGTFKKGDDENHRLEMDMEVKGPKGDTVFTQKNLLGENGVTKLEKDSADSPYGTFTTTKLLPPGEYEMSLTIYDKVGKTKAKRLGKFTLLAAPAEKAKK